MVPPDGRVCGRATGRELNPARFQRIDGGKADERWKNSPGVLWTSLVPYDETLRKIFLANHSPAGWGSMSSTDRALVQAVRSMA